MTENKPLKRFGQNYIVDKNIVNKFVGLFDPKPDDMVLEIGPGRGAITEQLMEKSNNVYAVEIDSRVIEDLSKRFEKLTIIEADILKLDFDIFSKFPTKIRAIGNIPFNITSPIIFNFIEKRALISDAMFIVQHEVAKRMKAGRGTKDYGILSVILEAFTTVKIVAKVSPNVFYPKPNVQSAIIHLVFNKEFPADLDEKVFLQVVKSAFGNRRKTLKNSLKNSIFGSCDFSGINQFLSRRAEELNLNEFFQLTEYFMQAYD
ncbi:MAG: ribosomal RNA small subunit methyltransferase A [Bacteroidetes bacterium]|nr:ribosomal RNA small subunit methyltransferase A [Bacteroidota bacterium]